MRTDDSTQTLRLSSDLLDARLVLMDSAQVFHWRETGDGIFSGVSAGRAMRVVQQADEVWLEYRAEDMAFWRNYFDLDRDYSKLHRAVEGCPVAARALELLPGMRILRQPPWEALVAFIISANNNVGRIRRIVCALIDKLGEDGGFPRPDVLASIPEETLRQIGCGYRAPYLIGAARMIENGFDLDVVSRLDYDQAHAKLLALPGVGDKVADCVQLFGMGHSMAFPVDVWVERLMRQWFVPDAKDKKEIKKAAHALFGDYAGLIQQSLFHCARLGLIDLHTERDTEGRKIT